MTCSQNKDERTLIYGPSIQYTDDLMLEKHPDEEDQEVREKANDEDNETG